MFIREVAFNAVDFSVRGIWRVNINSAQAKKWLDLNIENRRVRQTLVRYLQKQIMSGEWQSDHPQPIVFSDALRLIDGQHRLFAIASSDLTGPGILVRVETGAPDSIRQYLDTGINRTLEDRVCLHPDHPINFFAAKLINVMFNVVKRSNVKPTPDDAKEFFALHQDAIVWAYNIHKRDRGVGLLAVACAAVQYWELAPQKADEFYRDLFVSAGRIQQAQMLRDWLLRALRSSGGGSVGVEAYQKSVGCMKLHLNNREVQKVLRNSSW